MKLKLPKNSSMSSITITLAQDGVDDNPEILTIATVDQGAGPYITLKTDSKWALEAADIPVLAKLLKDVLKVAEENKYE